MVTAPISSAPNNNNNPGASGQTAARSNHHSQQQQPQMYIPSTIRDPNSNHQYSKESLLGKGGFAVCHSYKNKTDNSVVAIKIISKRMISKPSQREKIKSEILIHRSLNHPYIVKFYSHFDDSDNIYFILELCSRRSMMELQKRRKFLLEPEVRYFLHQLLEGCHHLHQNNIIHRDLKLGNIFLDSKLNVKIGDFGLATKVSFTGERKKTLCGTPNYIAPEILSKKGHSFEVDIWSIGCIIYTLLVGRAPFETKSLKDTYKKIQQVDYSTPSSMSSASKNLLSLIFQSNPSNRPSIGDILQNAFFTAGYHPHSLPESCLTTPPQFEKAIKQNQQLRKPLHEFNANSNQQSSKLVFNRDSPSGLTQSPMERLLNNIKELVNQVSGCTLAVNSGNFATSMDDV
ncbi:MAG: Serine/threonine-protein kinase plk1, partial [Marteilia pararefringens]